MADNQVLVTEKTYEVDKSDFLTIQGFDQSKTWADIRRFTVEKQHDR